MNIAQIKASLISVQSQFPLINATLSDQRDNFTDEVREKMLMGYSRVNEYLTQDIDLFKPGNSQYVLELNQLVLCGNCDAEQKSHKKHLKATEKHFYETPGGGIGEVMDWLKLHRSDTVWKRAAGIFTNILSQPQLYIEGNHRTGALLMSYMLAREGRAPFVLTVDNARQFFEPASLVKKSKKHGLDSLLRMPKLTKRFAKLLHEQENQSYLLKP